MRGDFVEDAIGGAVDGWRQHVRRELRLTPSVIRDLVFIAEALLLGWTLLAVHALYFTWVLKAEPDLGLYGTISLFAALAFLFARRGGAAAECREFGSIGNAVSGSARALAVAAAAFLLVGFLGKIGDEISRGWFLVGFFAASVIVLAFDGLIVTALASAKGRTDNPFVRRVAILGDAASVRVVRRMIQCSRGNDMAVVGTFSADDGLGRPGGRQSAEAFRALVRNGEVDHVVLAIGSTDQARLMRLVEWLASFPIELSLYPGTIQRRLNRLALVAGDGLPLITLIGRARSHWGMLGKILMDRLGSLFALILLAPVLLIIALLIKLDSPGPVLFRQKRHGLGHAVFDVYKFRTMQVNADGSSGHFRQARRGDPRVTAIGGFLRRSSLDELPQLFNVLKGEMSLVGPRPHPLPLNARFGDQLPFYVARHRVLPGMTGLAQINGFRGETDTSEKMAARLSHDLDYIRRWSLWLDLRIMVRTIFVGFVNKNAF